MKFTSLSRFRRSLHTLTSCDFPFNTISIEKLIASICDIVTLLGQHICPTITETYK